MDTLYPVVVADTSPAAQLNHDPQSDIDIPVDDVTIDDIRRMHAHWRLLEDVLVDRQPVGLFSEFRRKQQDNELSGKVNWQKDGF